MIDISNGSIIKNEKIILIHTANGEIDLAIKKKYKDIREFANDLVDLISESTQTNSTPRLIQNEPVNQNRTLTVVGSGSNFNIVKSEPQVSKPLTTEIIETKPQLEVAQISSQPEIVEIKGVQYMFIGGQYVPVGQPLTTPVEVNTQALTQNKSYHCPPGPNDFAKPTYLAQESNQIVKKFMT